MTPTRIRQRRLLDQLQHGDARHLSSVMYRLVNPLAVERPHVQLQSAALLVYMLARHFQVPLARLLEIGEAIVKDAERTDNEHVRALSLYMEERLPRE